MLIIIQVLALISLFACFYQLTIAILSTIRLKDLKQIKNSRLIEFPFISVLMTAKDEESEIRDAVNLRLKTDYPNIEFIIINDRSKDRTPEIINEMAEKDQRVKAVHIEELTEGWLGKLNALNTGKNLAKGEWLLFSDGDAHIGPDVLKKVLGYCLDKNIDFVAILPEFYQSNLFIDVPVSIFFRNLLSIGRAYKVEDKNSGVSAGSGSFNFVRREMFEKAGGFERIKMEVIDDVTIGQILKSSGAKTSILLGKEFVGVKWYSNLRSLFDGMGRAMMVGLGNFSFIQLFFLSTIVLSVDLTPFIILFPLGIPYLQTIGLISVVSIISATIITDRLMNRSFLYSFFLPFGYVLIYLIALYGGFKVLIDGGLTWRDTFYPTEKLKEGRVFKYFPDKYNK